VSRSALFRLQGVSRELSLKKLRPARILVGNSVGVRLTTFENKLMQPDGGQHEDWPALLDSHVREKRRFYQRLAYGVLHSAEDADDVCQQAFLQAWRRRGQIRQQGAIGKWLARVVINESYRRLRQGRSERRLLEGRVQTASDTPRAAELVERRDLVMTALAQLSEPIREVVTLRTMQGMSGNEVSVLLETSASDVSRRLHEGLDQLRKLLSDGQETGG
jgi:RNA polymerase sigma-70 factor, ECF subfamily